ncbi:MAG: DUF3467 domain-containing protein [Pseudomonadota bacterium]|nr:DUF3467 domain-containing protein [Pseudomonadota bacterium]
MNKETKPEMREVKLVASKESKTGRVYANYVQVALSPYDMTLRFCDAPPGSDITGKKKEMEIPTQCEVVIPIEVAGILANVLKSTYNNYHETYDQEEPPQDSEEN